MLILVNRAPVTLERNHGHHPNLGVLSSPRAVYRQVRGYPWAADNDAFLAWDEVKYRRMLRTIRGMAGGLFVTVPDVVGDAGATLTRFHEWLPTVRKAGQPVALVAQDGIEDTEVPWGDMDALFIGGANDEEGRALFKYGLVVRELVTEARRRGLWVHMGRVNTQQRIKYAQAIGCHSIDGTTFSRFQLRYLPDALSQCANGHQLLLTEGE